MANLYKELGNTSFICPFCGQEHENRNIPDAFYFNCLGEFYLNIDSCNEELNRRQYSDEEKILAWSKLAHYIARNYLFYKRELYTGIPPVDFIWVLDNVRLPTPAQQADNLILYIAENTKSLGQYIEIEYNSPKSGKKIQAWIGAVNEHNLIEILRELTANKLITNMRPMSAASCCPALTIAGWNRAEELKKVNRQSTQAFMAMKFDNNQLKFIKAKLSPVIKKLGFDLKLLPDIASKENLIDNKLRVAIRQSRFLICDLTHGNRGAYWEAGYAEGLGLPVIYICEKDILKDTSKIHFDVSHQEIYTWENDNEQDIQSFLDKISDKIYLITH